MDETDSKTNGVCEKCPLRITLDCAEQEVKAMDGYLHIDPQRALGGIAITKSCLTRVASEVNCMQPQAGPNKDPKCPLEDMTMRTRAFAFSPWSQANFTVKLEELSAETTDKPQDGHGHYL